MAEHNELGKKGENLAEEYLLSKGHQIITRNYRYEKAEVDIISSHEGTIIFTEVKTRSSARHGYPEAAISEKKKQMLRSAMDYYLAEYQIREEARFDIISIVISSTQEIDIYHIEDAFYH